MSAGERTGQAGSADGALEAVGAPGPVNGRRRWAGLLPLAILALFLPPAAWGGLVWPDLDLLLMPVLGHRSIITHSALLPVLAVAVCPKRFPAHAIAWFSFGLAIHLIADFFPRSWRGFALIQLPVGGGSIGVLWSPVWIAANAVLALGLCEWLLRREGRLLSAWHYVGSAVALGCYAFLNEGKPWLVIVMIAMWGAMAVIVRKVLAGTRRAPEFAVAADAA